MSQTKKGELSFSGLHYGGRKTRQTTVKAHNHSQVGLTPSHLYGLTVNRREVCVRRLALSMAFGIWALFHKAHVAVRTFCETSSIDCDIHDRKKTIVKRIMKLTSFSRDTTWVRIVKLLNALGNSN